MEKILNFISGKYRWLSHLIFWLVFVAFYTVAYGNMTACYTLKFTHTILLLPTIIPATYFTLHILFNRFLLHKKYTFFFVGFLISAFLFSYLQVLMETKVILPRLYNKTVEGNANYLLVGLVHVYSIVLLAGVVKLMKDYFLSRELNQQLHQEKLETELKFLKGQINPHFLFNTLNNLYSLALSNNKNTAPGIMRLSHLMDYMLNESNVDVVRLDKEVELINNYLSLEKLRYTNKLMASFDVKGEIENIKIAPLLLLPFIENAFKHGISQKREENWLMIFLQTTKTELRFTVENSIPEKIKEQVYIKNHGIGLKNVKRRLELIYASNYSLDIKEEQDRFSIELILKFKEEKLI